MATINIQGKDYIAGSQEATQALADYGNTLGLNFPATNKISANEMQSTTPFPTVDYNNNTQPSTAINATNNLYSQGTSTNESLSYFQKQFEEMNRQLTEERSKQKTLTEQMFSKQPSYEDRLAELKTQYGIPEKLDELQQQNIKISNLRSQIDKLDVSMQEEIDKTYERAGSDMSFANSTEREIRRRYGSQKAYLAVELGAASMVAEAIQGNITGANSMISQILNAYTFDQQYQQKQYEFLYNYHSDFIDNLDENQRNILNMAYNESKNEEARIRADKSSVLSLQLQYPNAGININDTPESATQKASQWQATQPVEGTGLRVDNVLNAFDILQDAINQGATPSEAARAAASVYEGMGIQVTKEDINNWTTQASGMKKIVPTKTTTIKKQPSNQAAANIGTGTRGVFRTLFAGEGGEKIIGKPIVETGRTIVSFFSGLFGE